MAKEMPVGTIRDWKSGTVIKAHMPIPPFSSGWITLKTNTELTKLGSTCDVLAATAKGYTMPINGEKFLDHEIDEFTDEDGVKIFTADSFKQYFGFYGAGRYAFRNEFFKQFMSDDMKLSEEIYNAYVEANEGRGGHKDNDLLSREEKAEIRARVTAEHKADPNRFTIAKAEQLKNIIGRTIVQVKEGTNFKDPAKKELYDRFITDMDSIPAFYDRIKTKRLLKNGWITKMDEAFTDNWGVRESCKDYANKKFGDYVRKYTDQIAKDSLDDQMATFGVTIDMEPDEFYGKIYDKIRGGDFGWLEDYVGNEIGLITNETSSGKKIKTTVLQDKLGYYVEIHGEKVYAANWASEGIKVQEEYDPYGDFKELIFLRFMSKYNKSVEGDWKLDHLPAIHNLENAINTLPKGHFLTNEHLNLITNQDYKGGSHGGYAWYDSQDKRINFSASCIDRGSVFGVLANPHEFKSTLLHEIGHAVSKKLGREGFYDYKKFVVECGWTYESPELRAGATATGDDKDIPRTGSNSSLHLISEYSGKSPEEAFAEYYSFYSSNKERIDNFLISGDKQHLNGETRIESAIATSERSIRETMPHRMLRPDSAEIDTFHNVVARLSGGEEHNKIELISPWDTKLTREEKGRLSPEKIKMRKNDSIASMPPIVTYIDKGINHVIDGGVRVEVARMNKRLAPSITISKELYFQLKESGLNDRAITDCVYTKNRLESLIKEAIPKEIVHGLIHRNRLVKTSKIVTNANILKAMKAIYDSKELQKAIQSLFTHDEDLFEKALHDGSISGELFDIMKAKDLSKLKKIKKLIYRGGQLIYATYWVKTGATEQVDEKTGYSGAIDQDIVEGDHLQIKTSKRHMRGEVCGFSFEKATALHWIAILGDDSGKVEWVRVDAITAIRKSDVTGVTMEPAKPTSPKGVIKYSDFKLLSSLGGSSDVNLMEAGGNKYAVKKARDRAEGKGQLKDEYIADRIYQALGFSAPDSFLIENGEYKVAPYLEGYRELGASDKAYNEEICKGFVLDCLLANWDVVGMNKDNILCRGGKVVRIDNGGSLRYRARGGDKTSLFTTGVSEIETLRDSSKNPVTAEVYAGVTEDDIRRQALDICGYREDILKCADGDEWLKKRLGERIDWLQKKYVDKPKEPAKPKVKAPRAGMPSLVTQDYFDKGWDSLEVDYAPGTKEQIKKHILDIEKENENNYIAYAEKHGITVEEYKKKAQEFVEKAVAKSNFYVTVHSSTHSGKSVLQKIFTKSGRFKSLFETGTGSGSISTWSRARCEDKLFGLGEEGMNKEIRPIYGYWTHGENGIINAEGEIPPPNFVNIYGDVNVEVKRDVAMKKATITFHDSLGEESTSTATPAAKPHFTSLGMTDAIDLGKSLSSKSTSYNPWSYVETQYHNQLGLSDVTKVHMSPEAFPGDRRAKMGRLTSAVNSMTEFAAETGNKEIKIEIF